MNTISIIIYSLMDISLVLAILYVIYKFKNKQYEVVRTKVNTVKYKDKEVFHSEEEIEKLKTMSDKVEAKEDFKNMNIPIHLNEVLTQPTYTQNIPNNTYGANVQNNINNIDNNSVTDISHANNVIMPDFERMQQDSLSDILNSHMQNKL